MTLRVAAGWDPAYVFELPTAVWAPLSLGDALRALAEAEDALRDGYWIAGGLSYEFGVQLCGMATGSSALPLLLLGAFGSPKKRRFHGTAPRYSLSKPLPRTAYPEYAKNVEYLLQRIREGEVYQVNYTVPFDLGFRGDPFSLYRYLARRSRARYTAFLQHGDFAAVSISPELFLRFDGDRVRTKPMKGTSHPADTAPLYDEKNRAEHVMIVDLLRNDLQRACARDVRVERLLDVERYPTFATMTSTIGGVLPRDTTFADVLRATFPCGSITGAPKRAAMQHIAHVERDPRGFYTGGIGFLSPRRRGWWNVAIRTLQIRDEAARFDAGGGIVSDSQAGAEWHEIAVKSSFLNAASRDFSLIETFRAGPDPSDVQAHISRLLQSAALFDLAVDRGALEDAVRRFAGSTVPLLVRLTVNRYGVAVTPAPLEPLDEPIAVCISQERLTAADPFLRHKSSWRPHHDAASRQARERGCFDAILLNERGEVAEGARTNIFVRIGETLYTPPLTSGALPGILRSRLLLEGRVLERVLFAEDLRTAQAIFAGNSARGLLRAEIQAS
ncbi:MAG TPA: bifunctional anthranilate synthase component I family protein/class IV aminotransferase [Candidatus Baltobacteraceae bacterium]|jgi:para-aminobenzoate synthetase/4-amino-4-deoxychorismate lyase|nr:bifunctional anthranilate synthase component I family protein/class IV aminotransferase [Candidatus Baltobacteraceae bacterium]